MSGHGEPTTIFRESDGEAIGQIRPVHDGFEACTAFGAVLAGPVTREEAVEILERDGLSSLASPWFVQTAPESWDEVRILEVQPDRVRIKWADPLRDQTPQGQWIYPSTTPLRLLPYSATST